MNAPSDVLALITSTTPWSPAAHVALSLGASFGAGVSGCYIDSSLRMLHGGEEDASVLALLVDRPQCNPDDRDAFLVLAREHGVAHARWLVARASIAAMLRRLCAWHDLVVIERNLLDEGALFDVLGEALLLCRAPSLILPPERAGPARFAHVALAWNGSIESVRAMHAALPLLRMASQVTLIDGDTPRDDEEQEYTPRFDPLEYLTAHGIRPTSRRLHVTPHDAGHALLHEASELRADLLAMGAYGHSRVRERVLGGATRQVLQHSPIPVLMQH
ncbi:universal stress protein [Dyella sp. C9]|uniref:universal stress protein n=1 Tax=Dyella sp. C9 TaxID=2202154 RepID=UPI000DEFF229|nr:universal stress protein [Dyella sp. C9]